MIPRMRTRAKAIAMLKELDPDTSITRFAIDRLIKQGKLPVFRAGNKDLINFDTLLEIVACGNDPAPDPEPVTPSSGIRRIEI